MGTAMARPRRLFRTSTSWRWARLLQGMSRLSCALASSENFKSRTLISKSKCKTRLSTLKKSKRSSKRCNYIQSSASR